MFERIAGDRKRGGRRAYGAAAASVAVHVLLVLLLGWGMREGVLLANESVGTGIDDDQWPGGGGGGGGGGGAEEVVFYDIPPPPPPPAVVTPPEPDELVIPQEVVPPPPPAPEPPAEEVKPAPPAPRPAPPAPTPGTGAGPGTGGAQGAGAGPGQGPGTGPGSGGGSGGGTGGGVGSGTGPGTGRGDGRVIPPSTDLLLLPPDPPRGLRGRDVVTRVHVDAVGNVTRVEMVTSSGDRRDDEALRRKLMDYKFNPARLADNNRPVAAATDIVITI
ncbi:MAG TPA: energy transducer TonB [Longimicrobium sp.]|nr:energy transducer TonB [Longimicrobium sp.]